MRRPLVVPLAAALLLLPTACGGGGDSGDPDADQVSVAADTSTCVADAQQVTSYPDGYPQDYPLPEGTVVFSVEDRGTDGVVATGVTPTPFNEVLREMNAATKAGFTRTTGETEEDDAEASWTGNGFTGRWAIKKSATCSGETVVQLLAKKA
ncbi:MAG TPA: hypothetical protein VHR35_00900 [Nocardioides sp.]|jgi:hypothetical protein|nr:hypothetical protein [Nocardioides sp.]